MNINIDQTSNGLGMVTIKEMEKIENFKSNFELSYNKMKTKLDKLNESMANRAISPEDFMDEVLKIQGHYDELCNSVKLLLN